MTVPSEPNVACRPLASRPSLLARAIGMMLALFMVLPACAAVDLGSPEDVAQPGERTVHVSGIACSEPREGVGIDLGTGMILTSGHVVDGLVDATVLRHDGEVIPALIVHIDRRLDVAVLSVDTYLPGTVEIGDVFADESGTIHLRDVDGVFSSSEFTVDRRIVARTLDVGRDEEILRPSIQITAELRRGDSGAGLWVDDQIVGLLWAISTSTNMRAFAVQGDELASVIDAARTAPSGRTVC